MIITIFSENFSENDININLLPYDININLLPYDININLLPYFQKMNNFDININLRPLGVLLASALPLLAGLRGGILPACDGAAPAPARATSA